MTELYQILEQYGEDQYKVLAKAAVYNEAVIIINEKTYTQKELEDPETLKKLINKAKTENDCKHVLDLIISLLNIPGDWIAMSKTQKFLGNFGYRMNILSKIILSITLSGIHKEEKKIAGNILAHVQRNRIIELKQKTMELRDKFMNDKSPEGRRIVKNCNEAIKNIDKYLNETDSTDAEW